MVSKGIRHCRRNLQRCVVVFSIPSLIKEIGYNQPPISGWRFPVTNEYSNVESLLGFRARDGNGAKSWQQKVWIRSGGKKPEGPINLGVEG